MRLVFMGTADFAVPVLAALLAAGHEVAAVYCQPPRAKGRGGKIRPGPVHKFAEARGLPVRTPVTLKDPDEQDGFRALAADACVTAAYGLILPKAILKAPGLGCFNVHASLLPRWRGAAPVPRAILAGDAETGVSIIQMTEGLDEGPVYSRRAVPITDQSTAGNLLEALSGIGAGLMTAVLDGVVSDNLRPRPQAAGGVTYAEKISPDEGLLDWSRSATDLARRVRAFAPKPGAWFDHDGQRIKVLAAIVSDANGEAGEVLDDGGALTIACGSGALTLQTVQRPGKGAMAAADFIRGYSLPPATRL
ncbi:MAG TPA: methionyl-tRNA formyltransferase [Alphaproteobacteria bacterium]|nr:methionyl-tRNA formyltransferase [Alphaproteobacteria bacterium]